MLLFTEINLYWYPRLSGPVNTGYRIHCLYLCREVQPQQMSCGLVGWGCRIHWLNLCREVRLPQRVSCGLVGWGCRIHWLHLCRGVRLPQRVFWYMTRNNLSRAGALGNAEYSFIAIAPRSNLAWSGSTWYYPIYV